MEGANCALFADKSIQKFAYLTCTISFCKMEVEIQNDVYKFACVWKVLNFITNSGEKKEESTFCIVWKYRTKSINLSTWERKGTEIC